MFDLRYHVASLAAVFLALIIGILVGVGIASQTDVQEEARREVLEERVARLQQQLDDARAEADLLGRRQEVSKSYIEESYPALMNGRLRGTNVALLFVGPTSPGLLELVTETLSDASAPGLVRRRALELPVETTAITDALAPEFDDLTIEEIGRRLGEELVNGGETPFWDRLAAVIVEDRQGGNAREADAVVVAHTGRIEDRTTDRFITGLYAGLSGTGKPAVGIERIRERPSRIEVYRRLGLSSVDSVDEQTGRLALALLLSGAEEGHYGLKETAENGVVPPIELLPLAPAPSG